MRMSNDDNLLLTLTYSHKLLRLDLLLELDYLLLELQFGKSPPLLLKEVLFNLHSRIRSICQEKVEDFMRGGIARNQIVNLVYDVGN